MPQPEDCADCGTAASASAAAVELQGFEIHQEEQQVYSAVGDTSCARRKAGAKVPKAKGQDQSALVAPKGLDWSTSAAPLPTSFHAP